MQKYGILINPNQRKKTGTKHSEREGREYWKDMIGPFSFILDFKIKEQFRIWKKICLNAIKIPLQWT